MTDISQPFRDLQALAQRVIRGDNFEVDLQIFEQFARDLRLWVLDNFDGYRIRQLAGSIPEIEYDRKRGGIWSALGAGGIKMYKQHQEREKVKAQVKEIAGVFDAIHRLASDETDDIV
ncbi:MAG: hypothetical protein KDD06_29945 [Phaeodactylibacter sp.]|nr:hypothetical protein [Phaeodactylibacter sp.]MCB9266098.1 hypothetical protein [Lewinellaceae bacterium]MCB9289275.1 hypothetical protein [Lewinellaceae bacterium]